MNEQIGNREFGQSDATHYRCRAAQLNRKHAAALARIMLWPLAGLIGIQAGIALCFILL